MQEMRDLLQQTIQLQSQTSADIAALTQAQERTQRQLDITLNIANSNARSIEAWEALIEQNKVDAEEDRSRMQVLIRELIRANDQNTIDHELFRRRFEAIDPLIDDSSQD